MNKYYRGQNASRYNKRWQGYTEKTLAAAEAMIDYTALDRVALQPQRPVRALDIACGTGILLQHLLERVPNIEVCGVDASADMLAQARSSLNHRARARVEVADLNHSGWTQIFTELPPFDLITCTNVLHDIARPAAFFDELRPLLAPEGQLIVEDFAPRRPRLFWSLFEMLLRRAEGVPVRALTLPEVERCCEQAGWSVLATEMLVIDRFWRGWALRAELALPSPL